MKTITFDHTKWQLAPLVPTMVMLRSGLSAADGLRLPLNRIASAYSAMLEDAPEHPSEPAPLDFPLGAIANGRTHAERLQTYGFECEGGNLELCTDWVEFVRCFEHLAEWAQAQHPSEPVSGEPVFHLRSYGDVTKAELSEYIEAGKISTAQPVSSEPVGRVHELREHGLALVSLVHPVSEGAHLYAGPQPPAERVPLTEGDISLACWDEGQRDLDSFTAGVRFAERINGIKERS